MECYYGTSRGETLPCGREIMRSYAKPLRIITLMLPLIFFASGCTKTIVLRADEQITPHPTDAEKVCLDKGYLIKVFEECNP